VADRRGWRRWNTLAVRHWLAMAICIAATLLPPTATPQAGFLLGWAGMLAIATLREADHG
jgi:uncharacterized membrane protein YdfJ with MMPL/SSD domain